MNSMFLDISDREVMPPRHLFAEGEEAGHFVKNEEGDTLLLPVTAFDVAMLDFTSEDAREWMKAVIIDEMVENAGCSGWMVDFAEALPSRPNSTTARTAPSTTTSTRSSGCG